MEYKAGVTKSVNPVANVNPKIIVTAIPPKATSNNNGYCFPNPSCINGCYNNDFRYGAIVV